MFVLDRCSSTDDGEEPKNRRSWRRERESNPRSKLCRLLPNHSAIAPSITTKREACGFPPYFWSGKRGSNSRPQPWQGCALPTELFPHNLFVTYSKNPNKFHILPNFFSKRKELTFFNNDLLRFL